MSPLTRRAFLGASLTGLTAGRLLAADDGTVTPRFTDDAPFQPSTLFLTWRRDPTTTMMVQWVGTRGETADTTVSYAPLRGAGRWFTPHWLSCKTEARPYPPTDFKVFRAELTGLTPGTDYQFRIG